MNVTSVMTASPACCTPQTTLRVVAHLMKNHDCGLIPVVDALETLKPVGTITDRDIAIRIVAAGKNPAETTAADCMSSPCIKVDADTSLRECCACLRNRCDLAARGCASTFCSNALKYRSSR